MPTALQKAYPWTISPLIASAPMRLISLAPLACAVSQAGGLGFLAGGSDVSSLESHLHDAVKILRHPNPSPQSPLPIGVGLINWGVTIQEVLPLITKFVPAAVWLFAPRKLEDLKDWAESVRRASGWATKVWVQVGCVEDALKVARICRPDVLILQGTDAGGHGLERGAGIISLVPEVADALKAESFDNIPLIAAGGLAEGRGVAAAIILGAAGVALGTRFLAAREAKISDGYRREVLRATDGGVQTARTTIYDTLRGTTAWPQEYNARGLLNQSFWDSKLGMKDEDNIKLYEEEMKKGDAGWGPKGRMTTYAGTGVGLVHDVMPAGKIVKEISVDANIILGKVKAHIYEGKIGT